MSNRSVTNTINPLHQDTCTISADGIFVIVSVWFIVGDVLFVATCYLVFIVIDR